MSRYVDDEEGDGAIVRGIIVLRLGVDRANKGICAGDEVALARRCVHEGCAKGGAVIVGIDQDGEHLRAPVARQRDLCFGSQAFHLRAVKRFNPNCEAAV